MRHRILTDIAEMESIILKSTVCHVAMVETEGKPYLVPMNFGYKDGTVYLHSAQNGKKTEILKKNPAVCIEFSTDYMLRFQNEDVACSYSMKYRSVLVYGKVVFVEDPAEKKIHLNIIMKNYIPREFTYNPPSIRKVCCWKVKVDKMEGRIHGY